MDRHDAFLSGRAGGHRAVLRFRNLSGLDFHGHNLSEVDFTGSKLFSAIFTDSNLTRAIFYGADLRIANFHKANLTKCDLRGACLRGAILTDSVMIEADMRDGSLMHQGEDGGLVDTAVRTEITCADRARRGPDQCAGSRMPLSCRPI